MAEGPSKQDIAELIRRLESSPFPTPHIREAGELLVGAQDHAASYKMAVEFSDSKFAQVRTLGLAMMEAIAPHHEAAKGFMAGARDAAKLLENGRMTPGDAKSNQPDYAAIGDVIKMMLRQDRENKGRGPRK